MALRLHHLPLLLVLTTLLPTASATHSPESATACSHHRSPTGTATAHFHPVHGAVPYMHQNHLETESQPLLAMDPAVADAQTTARPPPLLVPVPPQAAAPSPPPTPVARPDLAASCSDATPQPREGSATTTATTLPSPPPPAEAGGAAGEVVVSDSEQGLHQLSRALASLGYQEMAAAAGALLVNSPLLATWSGPMTVFAAPDALLQASCPTCSRRDLLIHHMSMGYYPYSELAAASMVKIPSASVNFCINIVSESGPFATGLARIYADDVEVSHPDLYNDGLYVVHGLVGFLRPLTDSCFDGPHPHHRRSLAGRSSGGTLVREAITRLRRRGFGVVAIALRLQFTELQRFANLTVFALDDQAIFAWGGHDYVSSVRFHIVLKHRLTRAELLRLRPGTILPTLAGEGQSLVITHGAGENVLVNYIHIKESDMVVNSRIAVHGIGSPLPHLDVELHSGAAESNLKKVQKRFTLHASQRPAEQAWAWDRGVPLHWAVVGAAVAAMAGVAAAGSWFRSVKGKDGKRIYLAQAAMEATYNAKYGRRNLMAELEEQKQQRFAICSEEDFDWIATCCDVKFCSSCLGAAYVKRHNALYAPGPCVSEGSLLPSLHVKLHPDLPGMYMESETRVKAEFEKALDQKAAHDELVMKRVYTSHEDVLAKMAPQRILVYSREGNSEIIHQLNLERSNIT